MLPLHTRVVSAPVHKPLFRVPASSAYSVHEAPAPPGAFEVVVGGALSPEFIVLETLYQEAASATVIQLCRHSGSLYILKRVSKRRLFIAEHYESARREFRIHRILAHPNIVNLLSCGETAEEFLYVLEHLALGGHFTEKLEVNNRPLMLKADGDVQKLKSYAFDILSGLTYLHAQGIVHLDIKPGNLLLSQSLCATEYNSVKICDFGLSRHMNNDGCVQLPFRCGSDLYIAPEVRAGGWVTPAADIWSFGVFLHLLVLGYTPYAMNWKPPSPLPRHARHWRKYEKTGLFELLSRTLVLEPSERITAQDALAHEFLAQSN